MKESIKKNLTPKVLISNLILIIVIIAFVSLFGAVFGSENTLIGVCAITAMLMFVSVHLCLKLHEAIITTILAFVLMGVTSQVSTINPFLGLVVNFVSLFVIAYLVTNRMETKVYLPFILCYIFIEGTPVNWSLFPKRLIALLAAGVLISIVYYFTHRKKDDSEHLSISEMIKNMKTNSLQFNFSLRMALSVSLAMFIGSLLDFEKSMWISMTAMSITQPYFDDTKVRVKERFFGTIIGAAIFLVLFVYIVPEQFSTVILLVLSYIYTFVKEYKVKIIFVTLNSLGSAMILFSPGVSIPMRIAFIVMGIGIALIVNKVIYGRLKLEPTNTNMDRSIDKVKK